MFSSSGVARTRLQRGTEQGEGAGGIVIGGKHLDMVATTVLHAGTKCETVDWRVGKNMCGKEREEKRRVESLAECRLNSCRIRGGKVLERVEFGFRDGRSPLLCAFDTPAFSVVEGEEDAQIILEEEIYGRRNGRVCEECVRLLNGLEILGL